MKTRTRGGSRSTNLGGKALRNVARLLRGTPGNTLKNRNIFELQATPLSELPADDLELLACRSSLCSELDDAARKLDDASGLRAAAADPVDDVPVQTPHANCKQDVCIELADALIAGE